MSPDSPANGLVSVSRMLAKWKRTRTPDNPQAFKSSLQSHHPKLETNGSAFCSWTHFLRIVSLHTVELTLGSLGFAQQHCLLTTPSATPQHPICPMAFLALQTANLAKKPPLSNLSILSSFHRASTRAHFGSPSSTRHAPSWHSPQPQHAAAGRLEHSEYKQANFLQTLCKWKKRRHMSG